MSGIFGVIVGNDDGGIRNDNDKLILRSKDRGRAGTNVMLINRGEVVKNPVSIGRVANQKYGAGLDQSYQLVGCAFGYVSDEPPPYEGSNWLVTLDGVVPGYTGKQIVELLEADDWDRLGDLRGQFALIAINRYRPDRIYYAVRSKPLFAQMDSLRRCVRIASQREYFDDMYHPLLSPSPIELKPNTYGLITESGAFNESPMSVVRGMGGTLVLCGGGLDSLVATHAARRIYTNGPIRLLFVDYGQKARECERSATAEMIRHLPGEATMVEMRMDLSVQSALTFGSAISKAPVAGIASEWVSARNTVLMGMALSYAEGHDIARIVVGINQQAADAYPDNEQEWLNKWRELLPYALNTGRQIELLAPLGGMSKAEIVKFGINLDISREQLAVSWSCYEGGGLIDRQLGVPKQCGQCSSCRARIGAFKKAHVADLTRYSSDAY